MKNHIVHPLVKTFTLVVFTFCVFNAKAQLSVTFYDTPYCNDNLPGSVCPLVTGGNPPYTFMWSDGSIGPCIYVYPQWWQGTYSVTIVDAMGLTATASVVITEAYPGPVVNVKVHWINETCSNGDGMAWVDITGGAAPYTIAFSPSAGISNPFNDTIFNLSAGQYGVYVEDTNGCIGIDTLLYSDDSLAGYNSFYLGRNLPYTYTISTTDHDCPQLGSAAVHAAGGIPPITYEWSTVPPQYTDSIGGLFGGNYTVTISDGTAGCSVAETINIANLNPLFAAGTSTKELCDFNNGTATIIPQGGTPPFSYLWNTVPEQTTSTATNLSQGYYSCTFSDANQCSGQQWVYVGYTSPVQPNPVVVNEVCNDGNGSITLTPLLGTPPYIYQWSNSATTSAITNLGDGIYSFTVNDAQGCSVVGSRNVMDVPPFNVTLNYTSQTCLAPGTATATVTGAPGPFTFSWSTVPAQTTAIATGLTAGYYTCTVTDANGCASVKSVQVQYDPLVQASLSQTPALCLTASGAITTSVGGGQGPYTFQWSNSATTQNISNVVTGYYTVTITDANNCRLVKTKWVETYSNLGLSISTVNATCIFTNDGQATANVSNATPPLTYRWGDGQTTQTATGLPAGWRYGVVVTDANGCSATQCSFIIGYDNLSCAVQVSGKVLKDADADCAFTPGDEGMLNIPVSCVPGYYDLTNDTGHYDFIIPPGNYAVNHTPPYHMFQLCPVGSVELFGMIAGDDTIVDFYDTVRTALDLRVGFCHLEDPRPGFTHEVSLTYANDGNLNANAILEYEYDADVQFVSAAIGNYVNDIPNRKVIFTFNNLAPGYYARFKMLFFTPAATPLGNVVKDCATIYPVLNDVNFINNSQCDSVYVVGAYDPNDKAVTPKGTKLVPGAGPNFITREDSVLHYKIRFQNTGTYYAENVAILDTLDADLDPSTIERITASHDFRADFFLNKYLAFYFDNIFLPDSFSNEKGSHGFVSFYIKQKPLLANGTEINNRAAIYFDYNEPVITNTVTVIISAPTTDMGEAPNESEGVVAYPNPAENEIFFVLKNTTGKIAKVELFDLSGKQCIVSQSNNLSLHAISAGMYFFNVFAENGKVYKGKIVKR